LNLVLFCEDEVRRPLPRHDPRARHILEVLRRRPGEAFDAGLVNGPHGRGVLASVGADGLVLEFTWGGLPPPPDTITLLVGLPRPQTARDILREATTLGVAALHFVACEKAERSYRQSSLWRSGAWRAPVLAGAAQAFDTRVPEVRCGASLAEAVAELDAGSVRLALDNYEAAVPLASVPLSRAVPVALAIGPERGWSAADRNLLRAAGFTLAGLGPRVLRTETAVVAALTLVKSARGSL